MFLFILKILFCITVASVTGKYVQLEDDLPVLEWPKKYSFEATKVSLTSGLVEDVKYWRTSRKSRIDYNAGAVKQISIKGKKRSRSLKSAFGVKYEIHPQTSEEYENKLFCSRTNGTLNDRIEPEDILPDASDFEHVGKDYLDLGEVEKFVFEGEGEKKYLWVFLNQTNSSWIPVRIEELEYNSWLENLKGHTVWDIIDFKTQIDDSVFDVGQFVLIPDCTDSTSDEEINDDLTNYDVENDDHIDVAFNKFKKEYNRDYASEDEYVTRKNIFQNNLRKVQAHNSDGSSYKLAINKFSDRTPEENRKYKGLLRRSPGQIGTHPFPYDAKKIAELAKDLPTDVDLRLNGYISPVRDQESCGSCWTFGTTSAVEGALARSNGGRLLRLANQALIDCAWGFGGNGCGGGSDTAAYHWLIKYGLPTEEEYGPYKDNDGFCNIENMTTIYPIKGFTDVTPFSVEALKIALINHGPLSVSIHSTDKLSLYDGGIFYDTECSPEKLNHEVTLVGYGEVDGDSYWIVKNSWGRDWGIDGYFHISTRDHACGIATEPTYAVM